MLSLYGLFNNKNINLGLRLFWHKTISGNDFTHHYVFGCAWKIKFFGKAFQLTVCFMALTRKLVYISIFTTNHFLVSDMREREREHLTHTDPLRHGSPSSTHSSLSAKRRPTVSFLFQLIHFSVRLHLTFDPPLNP